MMRQDAQQAIADAMRVWDEVYAIALVNSDGDEQRAEQLTRAYMSGWLRRVEHGRTSGHDGE